MSLGEPFPAFQCQNTFALVQKGSDFESRHTISVKVISCSSVVWGIDTEVLLSTRRPCICLQLDSLIGIGNLLSLGLRPTDGGIINRFSFGFFRRLL